MRTGKEYLDSIEKMKFSIYIDGGKLDNALEHPAVRAAANAVAATFDFAHDPEIQDKIITKSHFSGEPIPLFQHVPQSVDDLVAKVSITRYCNRRLGMCSFRCIQNSFAPILFITHKIDSEKGTKYHHNFTEWIKYLQKNDFLACPAITDPKGNRRIPAHQQPDPDMYLRVVEKRKDGIVLRGAKLHQTGAVFSHEKLVLPSTTHRKGDEAYAVACAVPGNARGIIHISVRQSQDDRRREGVEIDLGNIKYGVHECVAIFDDILVPWERVFLCGEVEYVDEVVGLFGASHRPTTGGCKSGWADVLTAAVQLMAEYNGLDKVAHVKDKIADMIAITETMYSCGIAAAVRGFELPHAGYISDPVLANNAKYYASKAVFDLIRLAEDITGGILACCPGEKEMKNPEIAPYLERFLKGVDEVPAEHRVRMVRLIENISWGLGAILHSATHGGGSGQACKMMLYEFSKTQPHREAAIRAAKALAGITV
ncbi:MAG: 4-hydroxybutyryl-CoA dehydratase [Chloroflexi bacterium]|nr:4-hydroxybutyryl-CoA dehydratase [Chloroflexota bacterium]